MVVAAIVAAVVALLVAPFRWLGYRITPAAATLSPAPEPLPLRWPTCLATGILAAVSLGRLAWEWPVERFEAGVRAAGGDVWADVDGSLYVTLRGPPEPAMLTWLAGFRRLRGLEVRVEYYQVIERKPISQEAWQELRKLRQLEWLKLSDCGVTDDDLTHLSGLPHLRVLILSGNSITDGGLAHVATLNGLEELRLEATGVSGAGLKHLRGLRQLRTVFLPNRFQRADVAELKTANPRLQVLIRGIGDTTPTTPAASPASGR